MKTSPDEKTDKDLGKEVKRQGKQICQIRQKFCKKKNFGFLGDCAPCKD